MRDGNRVIGHTVVTESPWDDEQVDLFLAYEAYMASLGPHGFPIAEAMSDDANPTNYSGGYRYVSDRVFTDWAEKARLDAQDRYKADNEKANMNGLIFDVRRVDYTPIADASSLEGN